MTTMQINTFLFTDPHRIDNKHCSTTISAIEEKDDIRQVSYWIITLNSYILEGEHIEEYKDALNTPSHPMSSRENSKSIAYFKGFSVMKNEMTTKMINHLMMNNDELANHTGTTTPQGYRRKILHALLLFIE